MRRTIALSVCLVVFATLAGCSSGSPSPSGLVMSTKPHALAVNSVSWSPDGRYIASGSLDTAVNLWDVSGGSDNHYFRGDGSIAVVAWSPDSSVLAVAAHQPDHVLWLWRVADLTQRYLPDTAQDEDISTLSWSPDGSKLAVGIMRISSAGPALGGSVKVYDPNIGLTQTFTSTRPILSTVWSPNGEHLAGLYSTTKRGDDYGHIPIWDTKSNALVVELDPQTNITDMAWSPDSKLLALGTLDGAVEIWDWPANKRIRTLLNHPGRSSFVKSVAWSPDGTKIASGAWDESVVVRDTQTYSITHNYKTHSFVNSISWSPDSQQLAAGLDNGVVTVWSAK
jgi:WD40 repeat protein